MALRDAFQFAPRLNLRDRFLRTYARLSDPPIRWLTGAGGGGDPDATAPTGVPGGDVSIGGRGALAAALSDPTSVVNIALDAMGLLGGPIGTLAVGVGKAAMTADNAGKLAAAIASVGKAEAVLGEIGRGTAPPAGFAQGLTPADVDVATTAEQGDVGIGVGDPGPSGAGSGGDPGGPGGDPGVGDSGPGVGGGAPFRRGGLIRDRMTRPGGEEVIRAHEGEFVVRKGPAKKYRRLLAAINAGQSPDRIAALAETLT